MDEILSSVSMLAQDQYGNYVVQVFIFIFWLMPLENLFCHLLFNFIYYECYDMNTDVMLQW